MNRPGLLSSYPADRTILGDGSARSLLPVQVLHSAGEALFALSLVGSLFFNVSVDAARPRILLYLAVTMAPFAVLGPLIGPIIDRLRGGHRAVLQLSVGVRAVVALLLASQLKTLLLYPEALLIVVAAKVYVVARNTLVPSLAEDRSHLVVVNSRLARLGAIAGGAATVVGLGVMQVADAGWVLRLAALCYGLAALATTRVPRPQVEPTATSWVVESTEMHGPGIHRATIAMAALRLATGFVVFHVGFALKTSGEPAWVLVAIAALATAGGFAGTFVVPWLHRRRDEQWVLTASLGLVAAVAALAALRFHPVSAATVGLSLGLAGSLGRRSFDGVIQTEAPHARRGQAYAGLETRLEVAWVIGALAAVLTRLPGWAGLVILSAGLVALTVDRVLADLAASRLEADAGVDSLCHRLLATADAVAARGDRQQAALVAVAAAEAAAMANHLPPERVEELRRLGHRASFEGDHDAGDAALRLAHDLLASTTSPAEPD